MSQSFDALYHIGKITSEDERVVCVFNPKTDPHSGAWNLVIEADLLDHKKLIESTLRSSVSDKEKIEVLQRAILRENIPHRVIYFLNGSRMQCCLQDFPTNLPESLFKESRCALTGFHMYAHQYQDATCMLKPQVRFLIDGSGFGEVNAANISVPESYKNRGYINSDNFVDVFIQITADAIRSVVKQSLPCGVDVEKAFVGYRGGDEFAGVLFYEYFSDPIGVAKQILENIERERQRLFSELSNEDIEKLNAAGAAIQKRAVLGFVLKTLEESAQRELLLGSETPSVAQIPSEYAEKFLAEYIRNQIAIRSELSDYCNYDFINLELERAHSRFVVGSEREKGKVLAELFVLATDFTHTPHLDCLPNQALALNYAVLNITETIPSTEVLAAHIRLAEDQIDEQKISRSQSKSFISFTADAHPTQAMIAMIRRLRFERETLSSIKEKYDSLSDSLMPLEIAQMYDQLLEKICGDGSIDGVIRASVARGLSLKEIFRFMNSEQVYLFKREISGMRILNAFLGMSGADEVVRVMISETQKMSHPFGVIRHQGDSAILLHFHEPDKELLHASSERVQQLVSEEMNRFPGVLAFSAYKLAGKMIGQSYIDSIDPHFEPVGTVKDTKIILSVLSPDDTVGEILKRAS